MSDDDSDDDLNRYAGVLYVRDTKLGTLSRHNVTLDEADLISGDGPDDPACEWRIVVTTHGPLKLVSTARQDR